MSKRCQLQCFDDPRCCYEDQVITVVTEASNEDRARVSKKVTARSWSIGSKSDAPEDPEREQQVDSCGVSPTINPSGPEARLIELLNLPGLKAHIFRQGEQFVLKLGSAPQRFPTIGVMDHGPEDSGRWLPVDDSWELQEDNFRGFEEVDTLGEKLSSTSRESETMDPMWLALSQGSSLGIEPSKKSLWQPDRTDISVDSVHAQAGDQKLCMRNLCSPLAGCSHLKLRPGSMWNEGGKDGDAGQPAGDSDSGINLGEQLQLDFANSREESLATLRDFEPF